MKLYNTRSYSTLNQFSISILMVLVISLIAFIFKELIGYKVVALILLMTVSLIAMLFDILPVLLAATLSALIWNFFFIPPIYTFHIDSTEDVMMFMLYFIIALVNTVLSFKIQKEEKKARDKDTKEIQIKFYNTLLNSLSHELRTPISTIIGSIDTLKESDEKLRKSQREDLLNQIGTAGLRLNREVENLLNMSRLESGILTTTLDWCDTNEIIHSLIVDFSSINHTFNFEPNENLPLFKIDRGLMEQVIHNLLHNSIQYTPEKSTTTISSAFINEKWILQISDNGIGIPQENQAEVFNKFYRVPNSKTGGSGLGLSIVKGFVEMHYGVIKVENNYGFGITFRIEIPVEVSYLNQLKNE